ncbi:nucleotidyltransferase [Pullulanibacillus sp. KACC 23026]|uniref:nucleotidyltransferase n=1 Tax=Pullulanibacillus sp. KACC 23026 TaxID=3028315 RepID=UPI0023AE97F3|nr:nucleotidyltransferase [Pullulanibacillus sp. KACC 23026]WEG11680.1 nucleotidyltransferase [Pullulanibacillus sp. KACC 23026]
MKVAGVVVEYNPLHNGHLYHLQEMRKKIQPDLTVAVMSGPFLQRGEPALLSKWTRSRLALQAGIDLVFELPYAYATQRAEVFAFGAVSLLQDIGVTDLCFGSEQGEIAPFLNTLDLLTSNNETYNASLKAFMKEGYSYPKAQALAFKGLSPERDQTIDLTQPNNILGFHYIKASRLLGGAITCHTIKRTGAAYHDKSLTQKKIASATAIRQALFESNGEWQALKPYVPLYTAEALEIAANQDGLRSWEDYFPLLKYRLLTDSGEAISAIYEAEEGLENRLKKEIEKAADFQSFMEAIKTKRYTWTRLQRLLTHILTQATKQEMMSAHALERPNYLRLLGMSNNGQQYLNHQKETLRIPLISRLNRENQTLLHRDIQAAKCYQLIPNGESSEFEQVPVQLSTAKPSGV